MRLEKSPHIGSRMLKAGSRTLYFDIDGTLIAIQENYTSSRNRVICDLSKISEPEYWNEAAEKLNCDLFEAPDFNGYVKNLFKHF